MRILLSNKIIFLVSTLVLVLSFMAIPLSALAQFNPQINYQGKLTDHSGLAVPDGTYNMRFWLLESEVAATSSALWTEERTAGARVQVTNGLFSVMLGEVSPFTGIDFNQTLYLGVEIGGDGGSPVWDGEMSPRKIIGAVPAAFVAGRATSADSLSGLATSSFLRSDEDDIMEATSTSPLLTLIQNGTGKLLSLFSGATEMFTVLNNGNVGIATSTPESKLTVEGDTYLGGNIIMDGNASITGTLADSSASVGSLGQVLSSTATGTAWSSTASLGLGDGTFLGLSDTKSSYAVNRIIFTNDTADALTDSANLTFDGSKLFVGGDVGIGTSTVNARLSIQGASGTAPALHIASSTGATTLALLANGNMELPGQLISAGINWTERMTATGIRFRSVTYGNGMFVAVSINGSNRVMTSPDGVNWTARTAAANNIWNSVTYGNGLFVAVADDGAHQVMTSPDGINWTGRTAAEANWWTSVTYGNGLFVAVSANGSNRVMTSPDGISWTARTAVGTSWWTSVTYGNGLFVAVGQSGAVMTSPDGISWTGQTAPNTTYNTVTYGNGMFVAVSIVGVVTSPDGVNWTTQTADNYQVVTYGNGIFVAMRYSDTSNRVATSPDGINWTARIAPNAQWSSITYGNGMFVAVSDFLGSANVVTSGYVDNNALAHNNIYQGGTSFLGGLRVGTTTATSTASLFVQSNASINPFAVASSTGEQLMTLTTTGNLGIGTTTPSAKLTIVGNLFATGAFHDSTNSAGTAGMVLQTTATGTEWVATSSLGIASGASAFTDLSDVSLSALTANRLIFASSTGTSLTDSASLTFDGTNLGLGAQSGISWGGTRFLYASSTNSSIAFGENAGATFNNLSTSNIALGFEAGRYASTSNSDYNNFIGHQAGMYNTGGWNNLIGEIAGLNNSGNWNNFLGSEIGENNTGDFNNMIGYQVGSNNIGNYNNFIGEGSGFNNIGDYNNTFGYWAGYMNSGSYNNILGYEAGIHNTGDFNEMIGKEAGHFLQSTSSVVVGAEAFRGSSIFQAVNNVAVGYGAGRSAATGANNNILLGYQAADNLTTGANNIVIGYDVNIASTTGSNQLNIGNLIFGTGIDGTGTTISSGNVGIGTTNPGAKLEVVGDIISKGTEWKSRTSAVDNDWRSVTYGNGMFVAVSDSSTNSVMTSSDGINWTARTSPTDNRWFSVTYGNGLFVAVARSGTGNRVMTSPDGINWTLRTSAADKDWRSVTYGNGMFVAVGADNPNNSVMTSPDGINWTLRTSAADNGWRSVTYGNGMFVAVSSSGTGNRVMTSPDGINWTLRTSAADNNSWFSVTYGNGLFVAVGQSGAVMTSPDGINWTLRTSAAGNSWFSVTYGNGLFVAVGQSGTGNRVMTSPDGINWTLRTSAADNSWFSVTYGNGMFVAVSSSGTGNRVMTSGKTEINALAHNNTYQGGMNIFGNVGIGTTTPEARLAIERLNFSQAGVAGLDQYFSFTNNTPSAVLFGNRSFIKATNTATTTIVGNIIRIQDSTLFGNIVRGLEVQADKGTNTLGENTAISGFARTFGVRGVTEGDAGGVYEPAGVFAETRGSTQGNAIRGYSSTITTAALLKLFQDSSAFAGTGLLMNFGNSGGSFSSTTASKFIDLQNAGSSMFTVGAYGALTIGDGTTGQNAGIQIGYGGLCVDNDGSCNASTTGRISAVEYHTGNSDLAEMYFSNENLKTGEVVYAKGGLSVGKAGEENKNKVIGVVSTKPGLLLGFDDTSLRAGEKGYPIALSGRVPVRLSNENGAIKVGDELMLSSVPGVVMKATSTGHIVGIALEDFDEGRAYSDTYINQFGDDLVDPVFAPVNQVGDPRIHDGCYFGGGRASGEEECVPLLATTTAGQVAEAEVLARRAAELDALAALRYVPSEVGVLSDGQTVRIGQAVMFVDLRYRYVDEAGMEMIAALNASVESIGLLGADETIWQRLVNLANNFVDGVLSIFTLRADRVEVKDELCVDGVCVGADDLRRLLDMNEQGSSGNSSNTWTGETVSDGQGNESHGQGQGGAGETEEENNYPPVENEEEIEENAETEEINPVGNEEENTEDSADSGSDDEIENTAPEGTEMSADEQTGIDENEQSSDDTGDE